MLRLRMAAGAALVLMSCATALAADGTLQVIIGGEAYDGPPRFEVSFGGAVLGEAAVDAAIDTASVGRFAEAFHATKRPLDALVCNAAMYKPRLTQPERSPEGFCHIWINHDLKAIFACISSARQKSGLA